MTRFTELLAKAGRRETEPLGFGRASKKPVRVPDILLVGRISPTDLSTLKTADYPLDAYILEGSQLDAETLKSAPKALQGTVWGVRCANLTTEVVEHLKLAGADFVVFDAAGTHASLLTDDCLGRFLSISSGLNDAEASAVRALPMDGVDITLDGETFPLTIESVMSLHLALTAGAHVIVTSDLDPKTLSSDDLDAMRGIGVCALALSVSSKDDLTELKKKIECLPEPSSSPEDRMALIPHFSQSEDNHVHEEEDF